MLLGHLLDSVDPRGRPGAWLRGIRGAQAPGDPKQSPFAGPRRAREGAHRPLRPGAGYVPRGVEKRLARRIGNVSWV